MDTSNSNKIEMTVKMTVTPSQALALQAMFEEWTRNGQIGRSRWVSFYADGDGNFQPDCKVSFDKEVPKLTDEIRKIAIVKDINDHKHYDFDPVGWYLHK